MARWRLALLAAACSDTPAPIPPDVSPIASAAAEGPPRPVRLASRAAHVLAPPPIDARSSAALAQAACPPGRCVGSAIPKRLGAATTVPLLPSSWTVPSWFIDPSNLTSCAADTNSGTAATCSVTCAGAVCPSGVGPLKTYAELAQHRWGTSAPRIRQQTAITFESSQTTNADPIYGAWHQEAAASVIVQGTLSSSNQIASGTIALVHAKNRTTPQLLSVTLPSPTGGAYAAGQLVVNATHPSRAWLYQNVVGSTWLITQPMQPTTPPVPSILFPSVPEVDTWATSDAVTVYSPWQVNLVDIEPTVSEIDTALSVSTYVWQLDAQQYSSSSFAPMVAGDDVVLLESSTQRTITWAARTSGVTWNAAFNVATTQGYSTSASIGGFTYVAGGSITGVIDGGNGFLFDGDVIFGPGQTAYFSTDAEANVGIVYVDSGGAIAGAPLLVLQAEAYGGPFVWGPGAIGTKTNGHITYPSGASAATAAFLNTGGITLGGKTTACSHSSASTDVISCGITLTPSHLDAAQGASGFGGYAFLPGGPAISNF